MVESDLGVEMGQTQLVNHLDFLVAGEGLAFALHPGPLHSDIIAAQNHVLRRPNLGLAVGGAQQVAIGQHELACFANGCL